MGNFKYYESRGDKNKNIFAEQDLNKIKPYLRDTIKDHKPLKLEYGKFKYLCA